AAWVEGGTSPRKACDGEIETAPEQVNGAGLAEKGCAESIEHSVNCEQRLLEALHRVAVVGSVAMVFRERDGVGYLVRSSMEGRRAVEIPNQLDETIMEVRDGHWLERERRGSAIAASTYDQMIA